MQDKSIDAMAKKYKEEMMRLYARQPESRLSAPSEPSASYRPSASGEPQTAKPVNETAGGTSAQEREQTEKRDDNRLMHPPMPQIPKIPQKEEEKAAENAQGGKFPSPEELMAELAPRFDNTREQEQGQEQHEQGNYDFTEAETERMFDCGEGYLKLEVSGGGQPLDCALAAVFRVTDCGDVLIATFFTDEKGETEVVTLPVLGLDEKYTVTVAKEGFFTVHSLEIPIFDSIKSIQPVELKQEQK